jgi:hypothetical protein
MNEKDISNCVEITPNPTTGELIVTSYELQVISLEVSDIYGRKLLPHTAHRTPHTVLDISNLQNGIYFLRITTDNGVVTKKIIKN